jgi:hypothetical protein
MKILLVFFLFPMVLMAEQKPKVWTCDIDILGSNIKTAKFSLDGPTLTQFNTNEPKTIPLLTENSLSTFGIDKTKCQINRSSLRTELFDLQYYFDCGAVKGFFRIDFTQSTAFYMEENAAEDMRRSINMVNCRRERD